MTELQVRAFAVHMAQDLFTNGQDNRATRLVLLDERAVPPRNLGGWSEEAMADRIEALLVLFIVPEAEKPSGIVTGYVTKTGN